MNNTLTDPPVRLDAAAIAKRVVELPPLPRALIEAARLMGNDDLQTDDCVLAIASDQALSARVLRLANSPFYGAPEGVASIGDAVQLLGLRAVAGVVAAVSLRGVLARLPCAGFCFETHWRHALGTAIVARELAPAVDLDSGEAFLAGLLLDVGQLALAVFHPLEAEQVMQLARARDVESLVIEREMLGLGHDQIGAQVARHWHFPAAIVDAIGAHHAPPPPEPGEPLSLAALVHVADVIVHALDLAQDPHEAVPLLDTAAWRGLNLSAAKSLRVFARAEQQVALMASV